MNNGHGSPDDEYKDDQELDEFDLELERIATQPVTKDVLLRIRDLIEDQGLNQTEAGARELQRLRDEGLLNQFLDESGAFIIGNLAEDVFVIAQLDLS